MVSKRTLTMVAAAALLSSGAQARHARPRPSPSAAAGLSDDSRPPIVVGNRADLPLIKVGDSARPVVELRINGAGPFRLIVDTGAAGHTLRITSAVAERLHLRKVRSMQIDDGSGAPSRTVPVYAVGRVDLGGVRYSGVEALVRPLPSGVDGIVPLGFFDQLLLRIDFGASRLALSRGSVSAAPGTALVSYPGGRDGIYVPLKVGDQPLEALVDTGNDAGRLLVPTAMVKSLPTEGEGQERGTAATISQEQRSFAIRLAKPVTMGSATLPIRAVVYPALGPTPNLGARAFEGLVLTVDARHLRISVAQSAASKP